MNTEQDINSTRPVIIQSYEKLLSKKERTAIEDIGKQMQSHLTALNKLTNKYRDIVGFVNCDITFYDQFYWDSDLDIDPNSESMIRFALETRKHMTEKTNP